MKFRTLYDSSRDAIMILTPDEGFLGGNPAAVKLFGCKDEEEFTSCAPADFSPEHQPDGILSTVKAQQMMTIAMEKGSHFFEWTHQRIDESQFFADGPADPNGTRRQDVLAGHGSRHHEPEASGRSAAVGEGSSGSCQSSEERLPGQYEP